MCFCIPKGIQRAPTAWEDELIVNGNKIKCIQASREGPSALPWKAGGS